MSRRSGLAPYSGIPIAVHPPGKAHGVRRGNSIKRPVIALPAVSTPEVPLEALDINRSFVFAVLDRRHAPCWRACGWVAIRPKDPTMR
jgi:hypothetical protein